MSWHFAVFSEHNVQLLMFSEIDAAEQEGGGFWVLSG